MKKIKVHVIICVILLVVISVWQPLTVMAKYSEEELYSIVNDLSRQPEDPPYLSLHYRIRKLYFSVNPDKDHSVVFLGDSITYGGDWSKLFPKSVVENRGIGGDTTQGLLNRMDQVIKLKPSQVFLMIGTNDLCYGNSIPNIITNYRKILNRFQKELPDTEVYMQNVLPFNDTIFPSASLRTNSNIRKLNIELKGLAKEYNYTYIDLAADFTGPDGRLPVQYTSDGLHLSDTGYFVWRDEIKNLVAVSP